MTNNQDIVKKTANYIKRSITLKIFSVGILILLLLIPTAMIQNLIRERQSRRDSVVKEISQKWSFKSEPLRKVFGTNGRLLNLIPC